MRNGFTISYIKERIEFHRKGITKCGYMAMKKFEEQEKLSRGEAIASHTGAILELEAAMSLLESQ